MNRLDVTFEAAKTQGRKLLCPFLTAGYPTLAATPGLLLAAQEGLGQADGGAAKNGGEPLGVIELGIPFSDPIADGPMIQESYTRALSGGATVDKSLACVAEARRGGLTVPVMVMVSYSIVFKRGVREFAAACRASGVDGLILPDVPLEEAPAIAQVLREADLRTTLLVAPTTPAARRAEIARLCDGFIYYLSVSGITGERRELPTDIAPNVAALRALARTPVCVGFGISTAEQVRQVTKVADGAIVGSAVIRRIGAAGGGAAEQARAVREIVGELARGLFSPPAAG